MKRETKKKKETGEDRISCPVCMLFEAGAEMFGKESEFFTHLTNSKIEFLKAVKSVIDKRIDIMEETKGKRSHTRYSKITVEE